MDYTEKLIKQLCEYKGLITTTHLDRVILSNGEESLREVVEHPGGVTVIPVEDDGNVWCVRQFRYPLAEHLLETPAGKLERGEDPLDCAVRELSEETGLSAREFIPLGKVSPSPGFCKEMLYIYMARGLTRGQSHPDENELLDVEIHSLDSLFDMVMAGEIIDAKTIIAIMKAKAYLERQAQV